MSPHLRLLRRTETTAHTDEERAQLLNFLQSIPGVAQVEIIGVHPKGGYRVTLSISSANIDDLLAKLEAKDWLPVF